MAFYMFAECRKLFLALYMYTHFATCMHTKCTFLPSHKIAEGIRGFLLGHSTESRAFVVIYDLCS